MGKGGGNYGKWKLIKARPIKKGREQARKKFASCTHTRARTRVERVVCTVQCISSSPPPLPPLLMTTAASISKVAIKTEVEGVGTLFGSEFVRKGDKS